MNNNEEKTINNKKYKIFSFALKTHGLSINVLSTTLLFCLLLFNSKLIKIIDKRYIIFISLFLVIASMGIITSSTYQFINFIKIEKLQVNDFTFSVLCYLILILINIVFTVVFYKISRSKLF